MAVAGSVLCEMGWLGEEEDAKLLLLLWKVTNEGRSRTFVALAEGTQVTSDVEVRTG